MSDREEKHTIKKHLADDLKNAAQMFKGGGGVVAGSIASKATNLARWTRGEAEMIAESAKSAAVTTKTLTQKMVIELSSDNLPEDVDDALCKLGVEVLKHENEGFETLQNSAQFWHLIGSLNNMYGNKSSAKRQRTQKKDGKSI